MKFEIPETQHTFRIGSWLFLRGLALVFFIAFLSLSVQVLGLNGSMGILPARDLFQAAFQQLGIERYLYFPSIFWIASTDGVLVVGCWLGMALALLALLNIAPALNFLGLALLYLSYTTACQDFLSFQWDGLLIESGFLAALLAPWKLYQPWLRLSVPPVFALFLVRWLLVRLMLLSGLVKLLSGDLTWWQLSALSFHYETQPLPSPLAWFLHHAPQFFHQASTLGVLVVEILAGLLILCGSVPRRLAALLIVLLQLAIILSGSHAFYNVLTLVLCLPLLDDAIFAYLFPSQLDRALSREIPVHLLPMSKVITLYLVGVFYLALSLLLLVQQIAGTPLLGNRDLVPQWLQPTLQIAGRWHFVNPYGAFAVMTTTRPEIIIEGSNDGIEWHAYSLPFKPGDPQRMPTWNLPHQPRLDWQLWFAALSGYERSPWLQSVLRRLLENSASVTGLFSHNPFAASPPQFIRAVLYEYRYSTPEERERTGAWWVRTPVGSLSPILSLPSRNSSPSPSSTPPRGES